MVFIFNKIVKLVPDCHLPFVDSGFRDNFIENFVLLLLEGSFAVVVGVDIILEHFLLQFVELVDADL